jgi:hypothetical protein
MNHPRQDTTAESEAAELFTVAMLGLRGLIAGQYPRNHKGADVYAWTAEGGRRANIQVKYRHAADGVDFSVKNLKADFVVAIRANRGTTVGGRNTMQVWVIPAAELAPLIQTVRSDSYVRFTRLKDDWLHAWDLIENYVKEV